MIQLKLYKAAKIWYLETANLELKYLNLWKHWTKKEKLNKKYLIHGLVKDIVEVLHVNQQEARVGTTLLLDPAEKEVICIGLRGNIAQAEAHTRYLSTTQIGIQKETEEKEVVIAKVMEGTIQMHNIETVVITKKAATMTLI